MVQVKGRERRLTQRLSRDLADSVKYSTLWPSRRDSPSEARRAMPTSGGLWGKGSNGREDICYSPFVRLEYCANTARVNWNRQWRTFELSATQRRKGVELLPQQTANFDSCAEILVRRSTTFCGMRYCLCAGASAGLAKSFGSTAGLISTCLYSELLVSWPFCLFWCR